MDVGGLILLACYSFLSLCRRKDYLQGSEIPAVISPSRLVPIIATSPEPMATARLGQMVTLSLRRLAEQPGSVITQYSEPETLTVTTGHRDGRHGRGRAPAAPAAAASPAIKSRRVMSHRSLLVRVI